MSFTPGFAPDAQSEWHDLDFELQELVLDELDRLAFPRHQPRPRWSPATLLAMLAAFDTTSSCASWLIDLRNG